MKLKRIRCLNVVKTKNDRLARCKHYLADADLYEVIIFCKKCKAYNTISRDQDGKLVHRLRGGHLIKEKNNE